MTHKEMRDQVVQWLGLQDITAYDETQLVEGLLYQGTIDMLARTKCVARCVQLNTQANEDTYRLDHTILALVEVADGTPRARRDQTSYSPSFTLIRADVLRVQPMPTTSGQVQVWAVLKPQQMTADTDSPELEQFGGIPFEYHDAIVLYAMWKASDYTDDQSGQQGERYRILYEGQDGRGGRISQIRTAVNRRAPRAPRARVRLSLPDDRTLWVG